MQFKILLSIEFTAMGFTCFISAFSQQENSPPALTITVPAKNSKFEWNSVIRYAIRVSDLEDGNSEYNEIAASEVLMTVAYLQDSAHVKSYLASRSQTDREALSWMRTTTCFTCHSAKAKLIG